MNKELKIKLIMLNLFLVIVIINVASYIVTVLGEYSRLWIGSYTLFLGIIVFISQYISKKLISEGER